jgi:hypothetical protein
MQPHCAAAASRLTLPLDFRAQYITQRAGHMQAKSDAAVAAGWPRYDFTTQATRDENARINMQITCVRVYNKRKQVGREMLHQYWKAGAGNDGTEEAKD